MNSLIEFIKDNIALFDLIFFIIIIHSIFKCTTKGFTLSLLSFSKWLVALVITIVLTPKLSPFVLDYIDSPFVADVGLGIFIFIISIFLTINVGKGISKTVTWTGLGSVDKTFGVIFGIFKGYLISVCIFSLINWFYPYENWSIKTEGTYSFEIVYKGSEFLVNEFPDRKDYYKKTKEKFEKI